MKRLGRAMAADLVKAATLPAFVLAGAATVAVVVVTAVATRRAMLTDGYEGTLLEAATSGTTPVALVGMVVLGALPLVHEHEHGQIRTTVTVVPDRRTVVVAKAVTTLAWLVVAATCLTGAALLAARWAAPSDPLPLGPPVEVVAWPGRLVLAGLLALTVALALRHLVPTLVTALVLVIIVPPLTQPLTEHARWLPGNAAALMPGDPVLPPALAVVVALGWAAVIGGWGALSFSRVDV